MNTPRNPVASSPDDDPTGVRALLSSMPDPAPMPAYLVERISASLAAEQAHRVDSFTDTSVAPLLLPRRRRGRVMFAMASAAAAVALIGIVGGNLLKPNGSNTGTTTSAAAIPSDTRVEGAAPPSVGDKSAAGGLSVTSMIQVRASTTRYTAEGFAAQASTLRSFSPETMQHSNSTAAGAGRIGTTVGLRDCLAAIGAGGAQMVRADLAYYEGQPAVIIVATTDGQPTAYAVGHECSRANAALLHHAVALP